MENNNLNGTEPTKKCNRCGEFLPLSAFGVKSNTPDGLNRTCKACLREYQKEYYEKNRGGKKNKLFTNEELAKFTARQLMDELRARGYYGELRYMQVIKI